jgi:hypothetical protein
MARARVWQFTKFILFNVLVVALIFIFFEGLVSTILLIRDLRQTRVVAERLHTQYDPELGWVNIPNTYLADMYGPGVYLKINAQGFRSNEDFDEPVPDDKVRLICSGDSFTFGFGVSNDQTWCQHLTVLNQHLETVNMAEGGYGLDQAYLWYKRDGARLKHDVQLFAFITPDFERMQYDQFLGYGKPVLAVVDNEVVTQNVPIPRRAFFVPLLTQGRGSIEKLRSVQFLRQTFFEEENTLAPQPVLDEEAVKNVTYHILKELKQLNQTRGSQLVLVYLPIQADYQAGANSTDAQRQYIRQVAADEDLILIDLVEDFRGLPPEEINRLFIPYDDNLDFPEAAGHYSVSGNQYIAELLYEKLLAQPEIADLISAKAGAISQSGH